MRTPRDENQKRVTGLQKSAASPGDPGELQHCIGDDLRANPQMSKREGARSGESGGRDPSGAGSSPEPHPGATGSGYGTPSGITSTPHIPKKGHRSQHHLTTPQAPVVDMQDLLEEKRSMPPNTSRSQPGETIAVPILLLRRSALEPCPQAWTSAFWAAQFSLPRAETPPRRCKNGPSSKREAPMSCLQYGPIPDVGSMVKTLSWCLKLLENDCLGGLGAYKIICKFKK